MKIWKSLALLGVVIGGATTIRAGKPIELIQEPFANDKAIKLDLKAQEQMQKGDLVNAERTVELALQADPALWLSYYMRASIRMQQHKYQSAIQDCNRALLKYSHFIPAAVVRAGANSKLGNYGAAMKELNYVINLRPAWQFYGMALNERAWIRATCPDSSFRHGSQAIDDAKKACRITNWKDASYVDTLAAAYAESGDFDSAVRYEEKALGGHDAEHIAQNLQKHMALFKQHQPIRSLSTPR